MKAQILKVWSTNFWPYAQPTTSLGEVAFPHPQTEKLIAKSGEKHNFWDFEAQIAQIFWPTLDPLLYFWEGGGVVKWNQRLNETKKKKKTNVQYSPSP